MATTTLRLNANEYRWSTACRCPRAAVLQRRGTPPSEATARQRKMLRRGHLFEDLVAEQFEARFPGGIERQREVVWPGGILHPDIFVIEEGATVEVKSSTHPASLLMDAALQNAGQQHFDPASNGGGIVFVDPVDLDERYEPINALDYLDSISALLEQLAWAEDSGGLPECTAKSPAHCRMGKFCGYTDIAWQGWTPPAPGELADPYAQALVVRLYRLREEKARPAGEVKAIEVEEREVKAQLAELSLGDGTEYRVGPLKFKRSFIKEAPVAATTRKAYDRFAVERVSDDPFPDEDFGSVPF